MPLRACSLLAFEPATPSVVKTFDTYSFCARMRVRITFPFQKGSSVKPMFPLGRKHPKGLSNILS